MEFENRIHCPGCTCKERTGRADGATETEGSDSEIEEQQNEETTEK